MQTLENIDNGVNRKRMQDLGTIPTVQEYNQLRNKSVILILLHLSFKTD